MLCSYCGDTMNKKVLIHKNHIICEKCLKSYIEKNADYLIVKEVKKYENNAGDTEMRYILEPINCPIRNCKYQFFPHEVMMENEKLFMNCLDRLFLKKKEIGEEKKEIAEEKKETGREKKEIREERKEIGEEKKRKLGKHIKIGPREPLNSNLRKECSLSKKRKLEKKMHLFNCCKKLCAEKPFIQYIISQIDKGVGMREILCPCCNGKDWNSEKDQYIPEDLKKKLDENMSAQYREFKCPKDHIIDLADSKPCRDIYCPFCFEFFCRLCKEKSHPDKCKYRHNVYFC